MSGAIPPLPIHTFMAWCSVKLRDNFTFASHLTSEALPVSRYCITVALFWLNSASVLSVHFGYGRHLE
jgi:hypothetical protein